MCTCASQYLTDSNMVQVAPMQMHVCAWTRCATCPSGLTGRCPGCPLCTPLCPISQGPCHTQKRMRTGTTNVYEDQHAPNSYENAHPRCHMSSSPFMCRILSPLGARPLQLLPIPLPMEQVDEPSVCTWLVMEHGTDGHGYKHGRIHGHGHTWSWT